MVTTYRYTTHKYNNLNTSARIGYGLGINTDFIFVEIKPNYFWVSIGFEKSEDDFHWDRFHLYPFVGTFLMSGRHNFHIPSLGSVFNIVIFTPLLQIKCHLMFFL